MLIVWAIAIESELNIAEVSNRKIGGGTSMAADGFCMAMSAVKIPTETDFKVLSFDSSSSEAFLVDLYSSSRIWKYIRSSLASSFWGLLLGCMIMPICLMIDVHSG